MIEMIELLINFLIVYMIWLFSVIIPGKLPLVPLSLVYVSCKLIACPSLIASVKSPDTTSKSWRYWSLSSSFESNLRLLILIVWSNNDSWNNCDHNHNNNHDNNNYYYYNNNNHHCHLHDIQSVLFKWLQPECRTRMQLYGWCLSLWNIWIVSW